MSTGRLLLLDAPGFSSRRLVRCLEAAGHAVAFEELEERCLARLAVEAFDLLLVAADRGGTALAGALESLESAPVLVLLDDLGSLGTCPAGLTARAHDSIPRPASDAQVLEMVRAALARRALDVENSRLRAREDDAGLPGVLSRDPRMRVIFQTIESVADSRATVLLHGESGTGKSVLARAVHLRSGRVNAPFVVVNCGALPGNLLESELFGHVRGAFTGAVEDRPGKFEAADGGTIFLDEIGTASPDLQVKLLRVIEEGTFERVGESQSRRVDVRVVAATNVDLEAEVRAGAFRADLFYRLHVVPIQVPPLRERPGDVPLLAERFLRRFAERHDRAVDGIDPAALARLCAHPWPGNVRELENTLERAVLLGGSGPLRAEALWPGAADAPRDTGDAPRLEDLPAGPLRDVLDVAERWLVARALRLSDGSRKAAAELLGINRTTLFNKMRKFELFDGDEPAQGGDREAGNQLLDSAPDPLNGSIRRGDPEDPLGQTA